MDLSTNTIEDVGAIAIAEALKDNASLTTLYLASNSIGASGAIALFAAKDNVARATLDIDLTNNPGSTVFDALADITEGKATTLNLLNANMGDVDATVIAGALKVTTALTTLYLGSNNIGVNGAVALWEALKVNPALTTLDLSNNPGSTVYDALTSITTGETSPVNGCTARTLDPAVHLRLLGR